MNQINSCSIFDNSKENRWKNHKNVCKILTKVSLYTKVFLISRYNIFTSKTYKMLHKKVQRVHSSAGLV